ncbi:MAG: protein O-GlcNAc transferase [Paracoccaceae bacterium]|jgi:protein O-GlcNAc transferase
MNPDALVAMGAEALAAGDPTRAEARFRAALALAPEHPGALANLASLRRRGGDLPGARALLERACARPDAPAQALFNLGNLLDHIGDRRGAIAALRRATAQDPALGRAWLKLAILLLARGDAADRDPAFNAAAAAARHLAPDDPAYARGDAVPRLAQTLWAADRWEDAITLLRGLARQRPAARDAAFNLAFALSEASHYHEALAAWHRALALAPEDPDALVAVANTLVNIGDHDGARAAYLRALAVPGARGRAISSHLMASLYDGSLTDQAVFDAHRALAAELGAGAAPAIRRPRPVGRLRIGYVTADLHRAHPVAQFIAPILAAHARAGADQRVYLNAARRDPGPQPAQIIPVHALDDATLAQRIADDGVDLLIDLSGHTRGNRLAMFAHRPAPVSASMIGYPHSTGAPQIDWLIGDAAMHPPGAALASERIARLPNGFLCFAPPPGMPEVTGAAPRGGPVFGSLNHLPKLGDATLALWGRVMAAVPDARLLIKCGALADPEIARALAARLAGHGIARGRLILEGPQPFTEAMRAYHRIDIALDPIPYNGGTTTAHALWMGVPVVALAGSRACGRMGVGLLTAAGHSEWIAPDPAAYVAIAADLADGLAGLRAGRIALHRSVKASAMCDVEGNARALMEIYRSIAGA